MKNQSVKNVDTIKLEVKVTSLNKFIQVVNRDFPTPVIKTNNKKE